jgi:hypothetical protein
MCPQKSIARSFAISVLIGVLLWCGWFAVCVWLSRLPVLTDVSLAVAFQPWWRHWAVGLMLLLIPFVLVFGIHARRYVLGIHT